jgi:hypothetical protein
MRPASTADTSSGGAFLRASIARWTEERSILKRFAASDLASVFEQTPTVEMRELVLQFCDERTVSKERREKMAELARACATRIFHLASRLEEPNLCAYRYCGTTYFRGRSKHAPGAKYCSRRCAELAGERSAWNEP